MRTASARSPFSSATRADRAADTGPEKADAAPAAEGGRGGGPRGGGGAGFGPPTATGRTTSSDRQQAVVNIGRPSGSYLLVGDISLAELVKVAESL